MRKKSTLISVFVICFVLVFSTGLEAKKPGSGDGNSLNVPKKTQDHSNWCWAGASQSVLYFFGPSPSQCEIANFSWNRSDCCSSHQFWWNHICNSGNYLYGHNGSCKDVLSNWGVSSRGSGKALSWNDVKSKIDGGLPFIMGWYWTGGGGHALVGYGYSTSGSTNYMSYMDPWPGEGFTTSTYSYVVSASDHRWGQTLKTQ